MFDIDHWKEIFSSLKKNKWRTFFTAFGVFWGIFMLIIMIGSGKGLQNGIMSGMGDFATNSMFVWSQSTTKAYKGYKEGRRFSFDNEDTRVLKNEIKDIQYVAPRVRGFSDGSNSQNVVRGLEAGNFNIFGDAPVWNKIDPVQMLQGRFINEIDVKKKRKVAIIGEQVKKVLFGKEENPLGEYVRIQGVYFQVVGVFKPLNDNINFGGDKSQSLFVPYTTLQQVYNYGNTVHWFAVTAQPDTPVKSIEDEVLSILAKRHTIHPEDKEAFGYFNLGEQFAQISGLFSGIDLLIWIVGTGTLLAGVIGISNIMLVIVKERTQEIGVQRALGATPRKIISQVVTESVVLTTFAGYVGLVIGVGLLEIISYALASQGAESNSFRNPEISFSIAVTALIILIVSGMMAGIIPAKKAIRIKPIDALRDE
ncbi:MAG: ABC transporter permease [Bacteroidales bacterium]|nr:ABC transporter permease [Bacteroidales bacterium]MCF8334488.1 ABC transporter permease [Bacteroidales bacterium]